MADRSDGRYSGPNAAHMAGVSYRRLHYWKVVGHLHPLTEQEQSGYVDWYSLDDIALAIRVRLLTAAGISLNDAWRAAKQMQADRTDTVHLSRNVTITLDWQT